LNYQQLFNRISQQPLDPDLPNTQWRSWRGLGGGAVNPWRHIYGGGTMGYAV